MRFVVLFAIVMMAVPVGAQLRFDAKGKFKIVQFTDVHWRPGDANSEIPAENIANALDANRPHGALITRGVR